MLFWGFSFPFGAFWPFFVHVKCRRRCCPAFAPATYLRECVTQQHLQHLYKQRRQHFCRKLSFLKEPQRVSVCKRETTGYF